MSLKVDKLSVADEIKARKADLSALQTQVLEVTKATLIMESIKNLRDEDVEVRKRAVTGCIPQLQRLKREAKEKNWDEKAISRIEEVITLIKVKPKLGEQITPNYQKGKF